MPLVYRTGTDAKRHKFHRSPDCWQLKKRANPGRSKAPVQEVDLDDLPQAVPCRSCYPDAPHPVTAHRYCYLCESARACRHNGGVKITATRVHRRDTLWANKGDTYQASRYVWPEKAYLYIT